MSTCEYCGNWNPDGTVFCPRCGMHPIEAELIRRRLNRSLLMAVGLLLVTLALAYREGLL
jgi:predicted nucleic acid-binding Zn ribbon protein